jgi:hypothetical protein
MLRLKLCWFLLFLMSSPAWCAADQADPKPQAVLAENQFAFEPVLEGTQVTHVFILKNHGDAPLRILKVHSG